MMYNHGCVMYFTYDLLSNINHLLVSYVFDCSCNMCYHFNIVYDNIFVNTVTQYYCIL